MEIRFNATFCIEVPISIPDIINSDTLGDYKAELDCALANAAMNFLLEKHYKGDIILNFVEPANDSQEAIDEYGKYLENWITEYPKLIKKYESSEKL